MAGPIENWLCLKMEYTLQTIELHRIANVKEVYTKVIVLWIFLYNVADCHFTILPYNAILWIFTIYIYIYQP